MQTEDKKQLDNATAAEKAGPSFTGRIGRGERTEAFAELARMAATSPLFKTSVGRTDAAQDTEREPLQSDIEYQSDAFARRVAFSLNAADADYYAAHTAFGRTLELLAGECIAEALSFHGVTDPATVCETVRCVVKGGRMFDGGGFSREAEADLTELPPEQVAALSPEQRDLWVRQNHRDQADYEHMQDLADQLYPPLCRYFKRERAFQLGDLDALTDGPLYKAFDLLLAFAEMTHRDPTYLERFRRQHAGNIIVMRRVREKMAERRRLAAGKEADSANV